MKNLTCLLILCFLSFNQLSAQDECEYRAYNDLVLSALDHIARGEYHASNKQFGLAFSKVKVPFSADLISAFEVATEINDFVRMNEIAVMLAKGGIPLAHFKDYKSYDWYFDFEGRFEEYTNIHHSNFDSELKAELLALRVQDSIFNDCYHQWREGEIEVSLDDFITGGEDIVKGFKDLVNRYGFPSEKRMGYYYKEGKVTSFPVKTLLIHIYQRGELLYSDDMDRLVCEGDIPFLDEMMISGFRGLGNSTGVEQEMIVRYEMRNNFKKNRSE